jgi:hypothetical protein
MRAFLGNLGLGIICGGLLVVWIVMLTVLVPVLSFVGISEQVSAGIVSVLFFVAFWVIGLDYVLNLGLLRQTDSS